MSDGSVTKSRGKFHLRVRDEEFSRTVAAELEVLEIPHSCGGPDSLGRFSTRTRTSSAEQNLTSWMRSSTKDKEDLPAILSEHLPELIAGVLDGDGCVYISKRRNRPRVTVAGKCGYLTELVKKLVRFGVRVQGPYLNNSGVPMYRLNPRDFLTRELFFRLSRKQEKLVGSGVRPWR